MRRAIVPAAVMFGVGLLAGGWGLGRAFGQGQEPEPAASPIAAPAVGWPPSPESIVSFAHGLDVLPGSELIQVFTVPHGKRFVMTDFEYHATNDRRFNLVELVGGKLLVRRFDSGGMPFRSSVGIVFEGGTTVALDPQAAAAASNRYALYYNVIGYLVDE